DKQAAAAAAAAGSQTQSAAQSAPVTQTSTPPDSGYQRILVGTSNGNFTVDIVGADLNSTKVIVDKASDSDCGNNCPVQNLARYVSRSLEWGRDTGPDSVIANYPLLVAGGNISFSGGGDAKFGAKGPRGFISTKGGKVYIGYVNNATMSESAVVMKALGMDQA